jgi:hypothetical protein
METRAQKRKRELEEQKQRPGKKSKSSHVSFDDDVVVVGSPAGPKRAKAAGAKGKDAGKGAAKGGAKGGRGKGKKK